jgi:hypothetical protein
MPRIGKKSLLMALSIAVALPVVVAPSASAYALFGCGFGGTNLYWRAYDISSRMNTAAGVATGAWNNKSTPINFIRSTTSADPHINYIDGLYVGDYWGCDGRVGRRHQLFGFEWCMEFE